VGPTRKKQGRSGRCNFGQKGRKGPGRRRGTRKDVGSDKKA